jgi:beta-lactamase regulating signal transducer with metallopeptidase domain
MSAAAWISPLMVATVVAKVTLVLAAGWGAASLLRRAPAGARHLVWLTVLVGIQLVPIFSQLAPITVAVLPTAPSSSWMLDQPNEPSPSSVGPTQNRPLPSSPAAARAASSLPQPDGGASADAFGMSYRATQSGRPSGLGIRMPSFAILLFGSWLAVALVLLARVLLGTIGLARLVRRSRPLDSEEWSEVAHTAATHLGLVHTPRIVMSDEVEMAFACRAFGPMVVIPRSASEWSADRRLAVLLHEFAHVRRRDLVGHALANVACALYWFNPLVWSAARRLRLESELASDDLVLGSGVRPSEYAQHLLDMVTTFGKSAPGGALAMARPKDFEGRLIAILDRRPRRSIGLAQRGALVGGLGAFAFSVAGVVPVARPSEVAAPASPVSTPARNGETIPLSAQVSHEPAGVPSGPVQPVRDTRLLSEAGAALLLRDGTGAFANPMQRMLRIADVLGLDGAQADSIATLSREYVVALDGIWRPVVDRYLAASTEVAIDGSANASMALLAQFGTNALRVLTVEQRTKLPSDIAALLSTQSLTGAAMAVARQPDRIFTLEVRGPGARVAGAGPQARQPATGRGGR